MEIQEIKNIDSLNELIQSYIAQGELTQKPLMISFNFKDNTILDKVRNQLVSDVFCSYFQAGISDCNEKMINGESIKLLHVSSSTTKYFLYFSWMFQFEEEKLDYCLYVKETTKLPVVCLVNRVDGEFQEVVDSGRFDVYSYNLYPEEMGKSKPNLEHNQEIKASTMPITYFSESGFWGIKDISGDIIIPPIFDDVITTSDDLNITHFTIDDSKVTFVLSPELAKDILQEFDMPVYCNDIPQLMCMWHKQMFMSLFFSSTLGKKTFLKRLDNFSPTSASDINVVLAMKEFVGKYSNLLLPPGNMIGFSAMSEELTYLKSLFDKLGGNVFYDKKTLRRYICTLPVRYIGYTPITEGLSEKFVSGC